MRTGDADEDGPTITDEHGEGVGKEEWEQMLRKERDGEGGAKVEDGEEKR